MIHQQKYHECVGIHLKLEEVYREPEKACVMARLNEAQLSSLQLSSIQSRARILTSKIRSEGQKSVGIESFLNEYSLSTEEGIALMCLAEAFLRIPDHKTLDDLIKDKLTYLDWTTHESQSHSYLIHVTTWALMVTGKVLQSHEAEATLMRGLRSLIHKGSEGIIRKAIESAMHILSKQFVMGKTIKEALAQAKKKEAQGYRYSYDMLGEAVLTDEDAYRYFKAYEQAIISIGAQVTPGQTVYQNPGVSIKLSALHPRYQEAQREAVMEELVPNLIRLSVLAKNYQIGLTLDAEESERLMLSLEVMEAVLADEALDGWDGFGLAIQAYQKRAFYVLDWVSQVAKKTGHRIMVRLVKGAYWDSEIKKAQMQGLSDYPVFTRKVFTDVSYQACVKKMLSMTDVIYPQFATHNAYSVAMILELAGPHQSYEFQCLHGMGQSLYAQLVDSNAADRVACRVYAPVGSHEELLPYLVRRLLENGANSSFVNQMIDEQIPIESLIEHPIEKAKRWLNAPSFIPLPSDIFLPRQNSKGIDWSSRQVLTQYQAAFLNCVMDPHQKIDQSQPEDVEVALQSAITGFKYWSSVSVGERAKKVRLFANLLEENQVELMKLACLEAGKTLPDALGEVREAIDFCTYYAEQAELWMGEPQVLKGYTGESNTLFLVPRGVVLCVSPWNFPLAIFVGQVIAALVTGNVVLAKPAAQTPLIAMRAVELLVAAGVPANVIQLILGPGKTVGAMLVEDIRVNAVIFTGSTDTAQHIARTLAHRKGPLTPLIAETGGQNAMIVDSSALLEQVVVDVLSSAFGSAGQRCSALRILFIQKEVYPRLMVLLIGAMARLKIGDPQWLSTDIGPVIDKAAFLRIQAHIEAMREKNAILFQCALDPEQTKSGFFIPPTLIELADLSLLQEEIFGPVLHVIPYQSQHLDNVIAQINATGYGLTLGIHSRIHRTVSDIQSKVHAGNCYVNRNMVGAVVGLQPFGGEGLSGTGPKAGGPYYLLRLCHERTMTIDTTAAGGNASLMARTEE